MAAFLTLCHGKLLLIIRTSWIRMMTSGTWEAWKYDRAGRLCKASDPHGETVFERDALGRIIREVRDGHTIEHCYDSRSRLTHTLSDLGVDITHSYDGAGLPESVKAIVQGMPHPWEAHLRHDRLGRETPRTMTGGVACAMQYDGVGRPSRQSVIRGGHSLYNRGYRWDDDFRLSHAHDAISGRIVRYFYDDFGSLAEAEYGDGARQWRNPDVMGNVYDCADRTDRTYARGGQLREDRRWRYHYDKQGNLVLKTKRKISPIAETPQGNRKSVFGLFAGSNTSKERREQEGLIAWQPGDYAYAWLPNGMLGSVTRPDGKVVTFKYDALGRRIEKSFNGRVHRYLWDGDVILHEWEYAETDRPQPIVAENGEVSFDRPEPTDNLVTWVYDTGSYVPTAKLVGGKRYGIVSDYIGRPVQAYDEHGTLVWQADYDIYGNLLNLRGNRKFVPFRQLGQYEDEETELYYNRFRYYDPSTGGYISQDPISIQGGINLYRYVHDCNSWADEFGLKGDYHQIPQMPGYQKHHIIPQSTKHPLLDRLGFDVHQNKNIIQLPSDPSVDATRTVHKGRHNSAYDRMILNRLDAIEALDASDNIKKLHLDDMMENIGDDLRNKRIKLNCN